MGSGLKPTAPDSVQPQRMSKITNIVTGPHVKINENQ